MNIIRIIFPKTAAGREALRDFLRVNGWRRSYPGGSLLSKIDWDETVEWADEYVAWSEQRELNWK